MFLPYLCPPKRLHSLNSFHIFWEYSPFWLLPVLLAAAVLSWWQYRGDNDFSPFLRACLTTIRLFSYFLIGLLFLNPFLKYFRENRLPPVTVILVDNSRSVELAGRDSLQAFRQKISQLQQKLESSGNRVFTEDLQGPVKSLSAINFNQTSSNLDAALERIRSSYEGQNLTQVILASDGIINQGSDMQDRQFSFRLHTIGLGNTTSAKDLNIRNLVHNKVAYLGNSFPVEADIKVSGLHKNQVTLRLTEGGKLLETKSVSIPASGVARAGFLIKAEKKGLHEYKVEADREQGEITFENNQRSFFIEVVSEKQKVLILAAAPHPDLKAIRSALAPLEQLEVTTLVAGLDAVNPGPFNLLILHQLPDRNNSFPGLLNKFLRQPGTALWLIASPFTDFSRLRNEAASWLNVQGSTAQAEEAGNRFSPEFQRFIFDDKEKSILESLPPVQVPGAGFNWKGPSETILRQTIGRAESPVPLLSLQLNQGSPKAVFWGDGLWRWRLNEYGKNESTEATDNLIRKLCMLLLSDSRKKQLQVSIQSDEYAETDVPAFRVETFNELLEPVYDRPVRLLISGAGKKPLEFSSITSPGNPLLQTQALPAGAYHFEASTSVEGKNLKTEGDFIVRSLDLESRELQANHAILRSLSEGSGGKFCLVSGMENLFETTSTPPALIEFTDWNESLLSNPWPLALLLLLLSSEWLLRKINGSL